MTKKRNLALSGVIREYRVSGLRQKGLAARLGVTRQRLWDWEKNGVPANDAALVRLALSQLSSEYRLDQAIAGLNSVLTILKDQKEA